MFTKVYDNSISCAVTVQTIQLLPVIWKIITEIPPDHKKNSHFIAKAVVSKLTDGAAYELWNHHLGHPGQQVINIIQRKV